MKTQEAVTSRLRVRGGLPLVVIAGVGALLALFGTSPVLAFQLSKISKGPIEGSIDTTITLGTAVRVSERSPGLVGMENGGTAKSINTDNGNLNYDQWDFTSGGVRVTHEMDLTWKRFSFFGRMYYFYDWVVMKGRTERTRLSEPARRRSGSNVKLLDAYLVGDFELAGRPITVRVGNQVLSWGESTFIQNGINVINPVDVSQLRVAGAQLRDALLPVPMISLNADITNNLSIEGFYQFYWTQTEIEPSGTYLSSNDFAGPGGTTVYLRFGQPYPVTGDEAFYGPRDNPPNPITDPAFFPIGPAVFRMNDNEASDMGQGGVALRYFAPWLNDTEFGLYYIHYHSRLPLLSGSTGNAPPDDLLVQAALSQLGFLDEVWDYASTGGFIREYPEDIDVVGASFNTDFGAIGLAWQMEVSYRPEVPLQVDDAELLFAALSPLDPALNELRGLEAALEGKPPPAPIPIFANNQLGPQPFNSYVRGYRMREMVQPQATFTKVFGPMLGMDQLVMLCELGATWFPDLDDETGYDGKPLRFDGPATYKSGNPYYSSPAYGGVVGVQPGPPQATGFGDEISWGYRLAMKATLNNAIGPLNLFPIIAFSHDVDGTTPLPIGNFVEGRKIITAALEGTYLNRIRGRLSYTNYFDGGSFDGSDFNLLNDRDFISLTMNYSF